MEQPQGAHNPNPGPNANLTLTLTLTLSLSLSLSLTLTLTKDLEETVRALRAEAAAKVPKRSFR